LIAFALLLGGGLLLSLAPPRPAAVGDELVRIAPESTVTSIAAELEERGIIRSALGFRLLARVGGLDRTLRAGSYHLSPAAWLWEVLAELHAGQLESTSFTIPEGLTLKEIAAVLEGAGLGKADAFRLAGRDVELLARFGIPATSVEGYLFPETYTVARGLPPKAILEVMLTQFFSRLETLPGAAALTPRERHRRLILASIVEREAKVKRELGRIAGVFENRLARHMKLESCATVQYVLGEPKERLLLSDVRTESPYNTYLNHGLPPGPIASPGLDAIGAALAPESHDFLFFFARPDGSGRHVFSRTYAEHKEAQRKLGRG